MTTLKDLKQINHTITDLLLETNNLLVKLGHKPMKFRIISNKELATDRYQDEERELINSQTY
jgi:hypothetical protein